MRKKTKTYIKVCYGISSKADDNHGHVFMMDFDGISFKNVKEYLLHIQKQINLSDIYIIKSTNGYNAISLDVLSLSMIYNTGMDIQSPADKKFFVYGFERGYYTLRFGDDKKLVHVLHRSNDKEKSLAHKLFLEWFFDIEINALNLNDYRNIKIIQYRSEKHGFHKMETRQTIYDRCL